MRPTIKTVITTGCVSVMWLEDKKNKKQTSANAIYN